MPVCISLVIYTEGQFALCLAYYVQPELLLPVTSLKTLGILLSLVQMIYRAGGGL